MMLLQDILGFTVFSPETSSYFQISNLHPAKSIKEGP